MPSIKELWCYTVGHMILWEHYCYTGDCINVEASVFYKWLHNCVRISAAEMVVCICGSISIIPMAVQGSGSISVIQRAVEVNGSISGLQVALISGWKLCYGDGLIRECKNWCYLSGCIKDGRH
jgi:hypothetical protein